MPTQRFCFQRDTRQQRWRTGARAFSTAAPSRVALGCSAPVHVRSIKVRMRHRSPSSQSGFVLSSVVLPLHRGRSAGRRHARGILVWSLGGKLLPGRQHLLPLAVRRQRCSRDCRWFRREFRHCRHHDNGSLYHHSKRRRLAPRSPPLAHRVNMLASCVAAWICLSFL